MGGTKHEIGVKDGARRQITVVFIDIVGSSALAAETDAEDLSDWLEAYYRRTAALVEARGGEVTEYLGDGVVACFGLHTADELAASRAVDAALVAVTPLDPPPGWSRPVAMRGGVATGEVATRSAKSGLPLATGAVTTMACRIQERAKPGEVLIAESTRRLLRGRFSAELLDNQILKGFTEPQTLYRLSETAVVSDMEDALAAPMAAQFVGRMAERRRIDDSQLPCLIIGEAGIGKSALALASTQGANIAAWVWADGLRTHSSHYPFRVWLAGKLGAQARSQNGVIAAFPGLDRDAILALALVLGLPEGQQLFLQKANLILKGMIETALVEAIFSAAPDGAMLVVEDLHWLDIASFGVLQAVLNDPRSKTLKILLTSREDTKIGTYLRKVEMETISLGPLDVGEANAMVFAMADGVLSVKDANWLVERSGGNPLFLEQLFKSGTWGDHSVPATLMDLLTERIDGTGSAKPLLQRASILGRRFRHDVLAALDPDDDEIDSQLGIALRQGIINKLGSQEWSFSHALLHQAAYHGILRRRRENLHSQAAQVLKSAFPAIAMQDPALVAKHHAQAREVAPAILGYLQASQKALYQGAMADAEGHTHAAIDMCDTAPPDFDTTDLEIACYTSLGSVQMQVQGFAAPQVRDAFETVQNLAMTTGRPTHNRAPALFGSFSHAIISGDMDRAEVFCGLLDSISLDQSDELHMSEVRLATLTAKNCKSFYAGDFSDQFQHISHIRELYDLTQHCGMITRYGMDVFAAAQMFEPVARSIVGQSDNVPKLIAETDAHQGLLNIPVMLPYAMIWGAVPLYYAGQHDLALHRLNEGIQAADAQGAVFWQLVGRAWLGIMDEAHRTKKEGRAAMRKGLDALVAIGSGIGRSYFEAHYARMMSEAGEPEPAYAQSARAVKDCAQSRLLCWYPEIMRLHALNCDAAGRSEEAVQMRHRGIDAARAQGSSLWEVRLLLDMPSDQASRRTGLADVIPRLKEAMTLPELALAKSVLEAE